KRRGKLFKYINKVIRAVSSKRGAKWTVAVWVILMIILSGVSSGAKEYATSVNHAGLKDDMPSMVADEKLSEHFEDALAVPAILVFHNGDGLTEANMETIDAINKDVDEAELEGVKQMVLVYKFPDDEKRTFSSVYDTTFILSINLYDELERDVINTAVYEIDEIANNRLDSDSELTINITGPSGIASETTELFS